MSKFTTDDQLRAAAEICCKMRGTMGEAVAFGALRAALDALPTECATFDPDAVRALVAAVRTRLSYGVNVGLRPLVKAVEDSEKK